MSYRFDEFVVEPVAFRLSKAGRVVAIEPKALQVLLALIERRDRVVTKQELFDEVWPGVVVTENALTRAIAQLRKTLGEHAESPRYIETVPTRGYRFIGHLQTDVPPPPAARRKRTPLVIAIVAIVLLAFAWMTVHKKLRFGVLSGATPAPITARPLRTTPRFDVSSSISPDGTSIVYSAEVDGTLHLFVSSINGDSERQLTNDSGEAQPAWSPDGNTIAFTRVRGGGIRLVPANGGAVVALTNFGSRPSWSPDGTEIAFQSADDIEYGWNAYEALPPSTLSIVQVASRKVTPLTTSGFPPGGHGAPSWRRDGKRIAFSSCDHERCGIFTVGRDGRGLTRVTSDSRRLASPVFSVDGRKLYFVLSLYNASMLLDLAVDERGEPHGGSNILRESNPGVMQNVSISVDGSRLTWSIVEEKSNLFAIDVASNAPPAQITTDESQNPEFPAYSPDGKKIAYCAVAAGNESGIWIMDADGSNRRALTVAPGLKQYVRWSNRDWHIYYSAWSVDQHRPVLYRAAPANGTPEVAGSLPEDASAPMISPDLQQIAFNRTIDGVTSVWASNTDGSALRRMSADSDLARFPVWSPSGKSLAVQTRRRGSSIMIQPGHRVPVNAGESWPHSWSPDEKEIAFTARRDSVWNVCSVNVATGVVRKLTDFTSATQWVRTPSWSPDGRHIVFEVGAPRGNVWISEPRREGW